MHIYYINKIIESNDNKKMVELKNIFQDLIMYLKENDNEKYKEIEWDLYEIIEGKKMTKEKAVEWVEDMKPEYKWSFDDAEKIKSIKKIDIPSIDFYILMNMMWSDYSNVIGDDQAALDKYIQLSLDWYNDEDTNKTGSEKIFCYYKNIVR